MKESQKILPFQALVIQALCSRFPFLLCFKASSLTEMNSTAMTNQNIIIGEMGMLYWVLVSVVVFTNDDDDQLVRCYSTPNKPVPPITKKRKHCMHESQTHDTTRVTHTTMHPLPSLPPSLSGAKAVTATLMAHATLQFGPTAESRLHPSHPRIYRSV